MLAKHRRKLNMAMRVLEFSRQHPDTSPGYVTAVARLEERLARAEQLARQHVAGLSEVHVATARKSDLRRTIKRTHLGHLLSVAELASAEEPELLRKFQYPRDATTYQAFQTAANSIAAEAEARKELLMKHGLAEEVLSGLRVALDQFQTAVEQGNAGRLAHVGATAELGAVAEEAAQVVKVTNGLVRIRFANQPEILAAWDSASNVVGPFKPSNPDELAEPTDGQVKPAA
jgi:hypothetical protein